MTEKEIVEKMLKASVFKIELDKIADTALEMNGVKVNYTDEQLSDAALVFIEVFMSKIFDFHKDKISNEQMKDLATEAGKSLRETILLFAGIDMHHIYEK